MRKRSRRVWWVVGAGAMLALLFIVGMIKESNSPDARLRAKLAEVIEKYGFVQRSDQWVGMGMTSYDFTIYTAPKLSRTEIDEVFAAVSTKCDAILVESGEHTNDSDKRFHQIKLNDDYKRIDGLLIGQDGEASLILPRSEPYSCIFVQDRKDYSLFSRIRSWLPW